MTSTIVQFGPAARRSLGEALEQAARLVGPTLGPHGRAVLSQRRTDVAPLFLTAGVEILKELEFADRLANTGLQMIRDAAQRLHSTVGDGTATAVLLTHAIFGAALRHVESGADPLELQARIGREADGALEEIGRRVLRVDTPERIRQIAAGASGFDRSTAALLDRVADRLGSGSGVIVEESSHIESTVTVTEGFQCPHGYVTKHLVNRPETSQAMMEDPRVLVFEPRISDVPSLAAFLERASKLRRPLILFTAEIDADPIATLVVNHVRTIVHACAVRVRDPEMLEDIAAFTGAAPILKSSGMTLDRVTPDQLGSARRAVIESNSTTLMHGSGNVSSIVERLKDRLATEDLPAIDREALQERAARLSGTLIQFFAGGASPVEMRRQRGLLRGAVNAIRSAVRGGAVGGAGAAWIEGARKASFLREALAAPAARILSNSGIAARPALERLFAGPSGRGFDAMRGRIVDAVDAGLLDPWPVVREALRSAVSMAGIFLGCEALVTERSGSKDVFIPPNIEEAERARRALKR